MACFIASLQHHGPCRAAACSYRHHDCRIAAASGHRRIGDLPVGRDEPRAGALRQIISVLLGVCRRSAPVRPANRPITGRGPSACTTATVSVPETMIAQAHEHSQTTRLNRPRCAVIGFVGDADYRDVLSLPWTFHLTPQGGPRKVF